MNPSDNNEKNVLKQHKDLHHKNHQSCTRKRSRASGNQLEILEDTFSINVSPNGKHRKQLARQLQMSERSVQIWFQNRRAKVKHAQRKAKVQMEQAAKDSQLFKYHQRQQQQYKTTPRYNIDSNSTALKTRPTVFDYDQTINQQAWYPPSTSTKRTPIPRAQIADAVSYCDCDIPTINMPKKPYFPTPGPEPFFFKNNSALTYNENQYNHGFQNHVSINSSLVAVARRDIHPHGLLSYSLMTPINRVSFSPNTDLSTKMLNDENFSNYFVRNGMTPSSSINEDYINSTPAPPANGSFQHATPPLPIQPQLSYKVHSSYNLNEQLINLELSKEEEKPGLTSSDLDMRISSPDMMESYLKYVDNTVSNATNHLELDDGLPVPNDMVDPCDVNNQNNSRILKKELFTCRYFYSTTTLCIGSWHRLKLHYSDLLCVYVPKDDSFIWLITEGDNRFKIVINVSSLTSIEFNPNAQDDNGELTSEIHFHLSHPPSFYMEFKNENKEYQWVQCSDFTEGKQASVLLSHTIIGDKQQLKQDLENIINEYKYLNQFITFLEEDSNFYYCESNEVIASNTPVLSLEQQSIISPSAFYHPSYNFYSAKASPNSIETPFFLALDCGDSASSQPPSLITSPSKVAYQGFH